MKSDCWELFRGNIGNVIDDNNDSDIVVIDGVSYDIGEEICPIEQFEFEPEQLTLYRVDAGYCGKGCYSGVVQKENEMFWLDIVCEGTVSRLIKLI